MKEHEFDQAYKPAKDVAHAERLAAESKRHGRLDATLITAVRFCDLSLANALLDMGADPNVKDFNNQSLLGHAILADCFGALDLLLRFDADPNLETIINTPLIEAIYAEKIPMVERLLAAGADVNKTGFVKSSALHVAVNDLHDVKLTTLLLEAGADIEAKDALGFSPLDYAVKNGDGALIRLLRRFLKTPASQRSAALNRARKARRRSQNKRLP